MTKIDSSSLDAPEILGGQPCPMCHENKLTLMERDIEVPYFGKLYAFSMHCEGCKFHKADVETAQQGEPSRYTFEIESEKDMNVRIIKSAEATVKFPHITTIEPGTISQGYVTNIEGLLNRIKHQIEVLRDTAEEEEDRTKAKNLLKKIFRITCGEEKQKLIIEDPSGNSAIISERAKREGLKGVKRSAPEELPALKKRQNI